MGLRTRGERRRITKNIIKKRKHIIIDILTVDRYSCQSRGNPFEENELYEGELKNNNMMNAYGGGCYRKTSSRKAYQTYRHRGMYGPAKRYCAHDKQQIEDGEYQLKEFSYS